MACNSDVSLQHAFVDVAKALDWDAVWGMLENDQQFWIAQPMGRLSALHQAALKSFRKMRSSFSTLRKMFENKTYMILRSLKGGAVNRCYERGQGRCFLQM